MTRPTHRIAIDVGGTFTDIVMLDERSATVEFAKILSTPSDPSRGSLVGARRILARAAVAAAVGEVVHATTVATNAVLEGKGAVTGLITTRGFRDTLEIRRENRYDIYDLGLKVPPPLVPRRRRAEVSERVTFEGEVLVPLAEAEVRERLAHLVKEHGIEALAICLLHGCANPVHERRIAEIAVEMFPALAVSVSNEVAGEIREFERTSTTVVDAYVKPMVRRYVRRLADGLADLGLPNRPSIMLSHGGVGPACEVAESFPVRMIESGPAAGAIAAAYFARRTLAEANAIAFDMGGTTAKISVIRNGAPAVTTEYEVGHVHRFKRGSGHPLQVTAVELLEIGAGGGSIAHINELGLLNVGPRSAGADPGPACYGLGGSQPTVTDSDLVLGYLNPDYFVGGDMRLDPGASRAAIETVLGARLGRSVEEVAWGIHDVVNEKMAAATRAHAAEKGIDLRRFSLIAFGGAGPVHAYAMARKLGLARVVCPYGAGVASAVGCLVATPAVEMVRTCVGRLDEIDWTAVTAAFAAMRDGGRRVLAGLLGAAERPRVRAAMDIRCVGQGYSLTTPLPEGEAIGAGSAAAAVARFRFRYEEVYGHSPPEVPLEVVSLRARVESARPEVNLTLGPGRAGGGPLRAARKDVRRLYFEVTSGFTDTAVYDRYRLPADRRIDGPAVIEERETSVVVGPDARFHLDAEANMIIELQT
ncbi:MAG: hydantoinase/oxoprolinase family protein [Proteobacteria bacterium]|nr:hydantoinase/oxoprolinase family protein [Pseudomonadota bacterium]